MIRYLSKVADLVEERSNDTIGFFDESEGKFEEDWIKEIWISTYAINLEKKIQFLMLENFRGIKFFENTRWYCCLWTSHF